MFNRLNYFDRFAAAVRRLYRNLYDFPRNWQAHGWKRGDLRRRYWLGADLTGHVRRRMAFAGFRVLVAVVLAVLCVGCQRGADGRRLPNPITDGNCFMQYPVGTPENPAPPPFMVCRD